MCALCVSERTLTIERDGWTLLMALAPERVPDWAADKSAALTDPEFQRMYVAWEDAYDWDPADPRLAVLAEDTATCLAQRPVPPEPEPDSGFSAAYSLLSTQLAAASPAWRRLDELCQAQLKSSRPQRQGRAKRDEA
jgi:hypothetical protein